MPSIQSPSIGEAGTCLYAGCDRRATIAAKCDSGRIKHYCDEHGHGHHAGHERVEEWVKLEG